MGVCVPPPGGSDAAPLWLFTDARRLPDPRPSVARLPRGLAGVVLRHDGEPGRAALGRDLARICRARRLVLVVAGDAGWPRRSVRASICAPDAGLVCRERRRLITSSAHGRPTCSGRTAPVPDWPSCLPPSRP